ncbi:MAG: metallophosphoesterase [Candidatus Alcyoniella australis]|nr:metallophosphoesterase [Candidatus Alcyoniella australis]
MDRHRNKPGISRRNLLIGGGVLASGATLLAGDVLYEHFAIAVEQVRLELPHLRNQVRVALLTDMHFREADPERVAKIVELTNGLNPDLVLLGGDYTESEQGREPLLELVDALNPPLGCLAVMGNWEHWVGYSAKQLGTDLREVGAKLLVNQAHDLADAGIWIIGTDDPALGLDDLKGLAPFPDNRCRLVLAHAPVILRALRSRGMSAELVLCGHTHGGQIKPPLFKPPFLPFGADGYVSGLYCEKTATMYVSRGIGTSIMPLRINCPAEITLLTLSPVSA